MKDLLVGQVIVINGGTQGLGAAIARAAVREGATVVIGGRNEVRGQAVVDGLVAAGGRASFVRADVADVHQASELITEAVRQHGRVDGLVNAAGLTSRGTLLDTTPELFDQHIAINLRGPFFTMQAAVADMKRRGAPGTIVNILSIDSHGGQSFLTPYVAAKAGLAGLTKNAAHAHRWHRIRINGVNMGWTATDAEDALQRNSTPDGDTRAGGADWQQAAGKTVPMGKVGQPDEIADFVVFLLSDRSGVVTGSVIDWDQIVIGGIGE